MCGIAGAFSIRRKLHRDVLGRMLQRLLHRGPDSSGYHSSGPFLAGMRRLKINDLETGDQPLFNASKSVALLYNGEIYNSPDLRRQLESKGVAFRTRSDGEVICHLYDRVGETCFGLLDGMFAAALWDEKEQKLILARDLPGEKPLYYAELPDGVAFASDISSLALFPELDLRLNRRAVWDFLTFSWIPEPETIYRGIKALLPGQMLVVTASGTRLQHFENRLCAPSLDKDAPDEEVLAVVRETVVQSIRSRLLSDVPVGSFLSGGLDSSIVASVASKEIPKLKTFTIGFDDKEDLYHGNADESAQAEEFARRLGTEHHTIRVASKDFRELISPFVHYSGQPLAVSSALGIYSIASVARAQGIRVLLSGDGADEAFGGYSWYPHFAPNAGCRAETLDDVSFLSLDRSTKERVTIVSSYSGPLQAWAWHYYASEREKESIFSTDLAQEALSSIRWFEAYQPRGEGWTPEEFIRQDRKFYFVNEMLQKVDRMTMACSVEGRPPFAAPRVTALAEQLRMKHFVRDGQLKWALRSAFSNDLPAAIVSRPKHGFNVPLDYWFRTEWADLVEEALCPASALSRHGLIKKDALEFVRRLLNEKRRIAGHTVFALVILNRWLETEFRGTL